MSDTVTYRKNCGCKGPSSSWQIRDRPLADGRVKFVIIVGMACDRCHTAWVRSDADMDSRPVSALET